ncbi:MAG: phosphatidylserine decarboxylase [Gammaproteobacteria bacterium RIFCSPLOWO2_02_FULL_61_13]|nr:MAG: phosphatidylserine decarboxylase [Gammaproteobacteria bacterium RIFCSPLOWO2_02_FULL_61_13]
MTAPLRVATQHLLPQHALTSLVYRLTRCRSPWLKNLLIRSFCRAYNVNLAEAEHTDATSYSTFNAFFTRALQSGARPVDPAPDALVSPVDGHISQIGRISDGLLVQAKGRDYTVAALLGSEASDATRFANGNFATLYLAPHNYHRIHMPCAGRLRHMRYVPGHLFSVNDASVAGIDQLFARNERLVCSFDANGQMIVCLVGALFVGSTETVWHGAVTPARERRVTDFDYSDPAAARAFTKGEEMGRFNMGSTVILMFEEGRVEWDAGLGAGSEIRVGRRMGRLLRRT